ncbi:MAG TPA: type 4a pilus biogenesis protein PilO [Candidatus Bathyarchaeia archaeon]|nr:type 4a pilus biogenesis protein PilO [Candidatus Bathyarchaeia archaeon]
MKPLMDFIQNLEPSRKIALAIVAPLLIFVGYYFLVLGPRMTRTDGLRAHIADMIQERARKLSEAQAMPDRQKEVEVLDRQLKLAIARLPDEKEIPDLLSSVSNLGRDSGLDILIFRQKPETYQEFYAQVPVEMQVRGGYHQVAAFFDRVGKLDRIVNVSDISMKDPKVVGDDMVLQANCQVTTYRFLSEAERERLIREKKIQGVQK